VFTVREPLEFWRPVPRREVKAELPRVREPERRMFPATDS